MALKMREYTGRNVQPYVYSHLSGLAVKQPGRLGAAHHRLNRGVGRGHWY